MKQHVGPVQHFADVQVERRAFDPLHEEDRKPVAVDEYAFGRVTEFRKVADGRGPQVFLDRTVSLISISEITTETANCEVAVAIHGFQLVDVGKLTGGDERHSQPIDRGHGISQVRMRKTDRRALNGFGEMPCGRPVAQGGPGLYGRNCQHYSPPINSIRRTARSSFLILPASRSSSKNCFSSSSSFVSNNSFGSRSPFSKRSRNQQAIASESNSSTSRLSQFPESITTDFMLVSCIDASEATSTGALLKLSGRERGKLFNKLPLRQCSKHESPSAIAFHEGDSALKSSSTPTRAANEPVRAFSSEYHDRFRPFQEA